MTAIHPQLLTDGRVIGKFPLSHLLLINDAHYPWCVLVPDRAAVTEIYQLSDEDQQQLLRESSCLAKAMASAFTADKMNIAALGNVVPQLHLHHIVRYKTDAAWPAPVWGKHPARPYTEQELEHILARLKQALPDILD